MRIMPTCTITLIIMVSDRFLESGGDHTTWMCIQQERKQLISLKAISLIEKL
jgi:hypothetical protein